MMSDSSDDEPLDNLRSRPGDTSEDEPLDHLKSQSNNNHHATNNVNHNNHTAESSSEDETLENLRTQPRSNNMSTEGQVKENGHASTGEGLKSLQLPITRIKTIMRSSPELTNVSQQGYFLIARATELFAEHLAVEALKHARTSSELDYRALSTVVRSDESLDFLEEIVPEKITVAEYYKRTGKQPPVAATATHRSPVKSHQAVSSMPSHVISPSKAPSNRLPSSSPPANVQYNNLTSPTSLQKLNTVATTPRTPILIDD